MDVTVVTTFVFYETFTDAVVLPPLDVITGALLTVVVPPLVDGSVGSGLFCLFGLVSRAMM